MSKTHERTHEQTCCKLHKQTHNITVALMRKEMQNWPTNRIENATKMHEETHGQHHTNTRTKLLTNPTLGPRVSVHTEPRIGSFAKPLDRTSLIGVHSRVHQSECAYVLLSTNENWTKIVSPIFTEKWLTFFFYALKHNVLHVRCSDFSTY